MLCPVCHQPVILHHGDTVTVTPAGGVPVMYHAACYLKKTP